MAVREATCPFLADLSGVVAELDLEHVVHFGDPDLSVTDELPDPRMLEKRLKTADVPIDAGDNNWLGRDLVSPERQLTSQEQKVRRSILTHVVESQLPRMVCTNPEYCGLDV